MIISLSQCEYCSSYRTYSRNEIILKMNIELLILKNIFNYKIDKDANRIDLHIVKCIY